MARSRFILKIILFGVVLWKVKIDKKVKVTVAGALNCLNKIYVKEVPLNP